MGFFGARWYFEPDSLQNMGTAGGIHGSTHFFKTAEKQGVLLVKCAIGIGFVWVVVFFFFVLLDMVLHV